VTLTAGGGRQGRRRRSRSTGFRSSSAAAREPTRLQWRRRVEQRATTVQTTPRLCSTVPEDFFVFFVVTFRWCVYLDIIVFDLFWIFVICFTCKNCVCKKQKRKGKEKRKKI
jgi:hypothetical protein